ncbi:hypothetical protein C1H57_25575, partial [Clostridium sp. 2-1]
MFPITAAYIADVYIDRNTKKEVTIEPEASRDILNNARAVLKLYQRGIPVIFPNVNLIQSVLIAKLQREKESESKSLSPCTSAESKVDCCHWNKLLTLKVQS